VRLATLIQMTLPGAPSIYYGDEIGMAGEMDPYCRGAMRWDESTWDHDLFRVMSGAVALRHANPTLRGGTFRVVAADGSACAYARADDAATFVVAVNAGDAETSVDLMLPELAGRTLAALPWDGAHTRGSRDAGLQVPDDGRARAILPGRDAVVYRTEP
jgi:glycosidase